MGGVWGSLPTCNAVGTYSKIHATNVVIVAVELCSNIGCSALLLEEIIYLHVH